MVRRDRKMVEANGVDLCVESFGDAGQPAILLVGGAASSMDYWEDGLCERLAAGPRFVIRYDLRDTGQSASFEPGAPPYTGQDFMADALGLLDVFGLAAAHLVGVSSGGALGQLLAIEHPDRVASLTLMSTSSVGPGGPGTAHPDLPPMAGKLQAAFARPPADPDWSDRETVIDYLVEAERPFVGSLAQDPADRRRFLGRIVDRTINMASSSKNHWIMKDDTGPIRARLGQIRAPTLILHGTEDPLFPIGHGEALAREIRGATLIRLDGVGHEYPPRQVWDVVVRAILRHTAS
jgi:pimeloyl-ACP methyl ester carboxylesterase